jgi:hypothetical protein
MRRLMVHMMRLEQRDQHVDVEKRPHGSVVLLKPLLDHFRRDDRAGPWQ